MNGNEACEQTIHHDIKNYDFPKQKLKTQHLIWICFDI